MDPAQVVSVDLVSYSQQLQVLLNAVDCFPNGGLYSGPYAVEAARRYEQIWLPMLAQGSTLCDSFSAVPPLDVAFAWLVHRLNPAAYVADIKRIFGEENSASVLSRGYNSRQAPTRYLAGAKVKADDVAQGGPFAFTNAGKEDLKGPHSAQIVATVHAWAKYVKQPGITQADGTLSKIEPFFPPKPLNQLMRDQAAGNVFTSNLSFNLLASMGRQGAFLHSLLRPCYLERPFLEAARDRYYQFLQIKMQDPQQTLVPMMDVDLMWHTHMGIANAYHNDMYALLGDKRLNHDDGIEEGHRVNSFQRTKEAYEARFPHMGPYNPAPTQLIPTSVRHPLETYLGTLLQLYLPPTKRGHVRPLNGSKNGGGAGFALCRPDPSMVLSPSPPAQAPHAVGQQLVGSTPAGAEAGYAGGHAVYLACLVATQAAKVMNSKWHRCFKSEYKCRLTAIRKAVVKGLAFSKLQNLPLGMSHPYWADFGIRDSTGWRPPGLAPRQQQGVAVGVPVTATVAMPAKGQEGAGAGGHGLVYGYAASSCCPGCGCPCNHCRCATQRYNPFDMALLPVLVDLAAAAQRQQDEEEAQRRAARAADDRSDHHYSGAYGGYGYGYGYAGDGGGAILMVMMCDPTWNGDVGTAVAGDSGLVSDWGDPTPCDAWTGVDGGGYISAAPCGSDDVGQSGNNGGCAAGGTGDGGGGGACTAGGTGDGGGGGGGCGGGGGGCG